MNSGHPPPLAPATTPRPSISPPPPTFSSSISLPPSSLPLPPPPLPSRPPPSRPRAVMPQSCVPTRCPRHRSGSAQLALTAAAAAATSRPGARTVAALPRRRRAVAGDVVGMADPL
ncbi:putative sulfated surface glycoprotein 185-like [Iris pallida]|uniref:Sulfated surface glycoprotein 185-like n=1 Tax=Iris pallida TaxID=29817 RepID=A0AAX6G924_IRIPA|nr:putative sulfated surface glycoprotein 185-like [Iris pallida]